MYTRRQFLESSLQSSAIVSLAATIPCFLPESLNAAETRSDERMLVVIELNGGNDGINTVVPFADENYARYRRSLRVPTSQVLKVDDHVGLHPAMTGAADLVQDGRLAIVQSVGYPNPNRSHFESMAIWHSAQQIPEDRGGFGWLGRALDTQQPRLRTMADALCIGDVDPPLALRGRSATQATIRRLEELQLSPETVLPTPRADAAAADDLLQFVRRRTADARATAQRIARLAEGNDGKIRYPNNGLGNRLKAIARMIRAELGPRVYYTLHTGYDTHTDQYNDHYQLLAQFSGALKAFLDDLGDSQLADQVLVMVFSEFGRRVKENDSQGTDHGTAGPMFVAGPAVKAGLHGQRANLADLSDGDLKMSVDFRSVYANILTDWLGIDAIKSLHGRFEKISVIET